MTPAQFNGLLTRRLDLTKRVLASKGEEYATDVDRLHNFKEGAKLLRSSVPACVFSYASKHLVSIADIVAATNQGTYPDRDVVDEKIGDAINYLILLEAALAEHYPTGEEQK